MTKYQWRSFTIMPDGGVDETVHESTPSLAWLQLQVGGYIETVPYFTAFQGRARGTAYCNEEGLLKRLPYNATATTAWAERYAHATQLVGNVVITFREKMESSK